MGRAVEGPIVVNGRAVIRTQISGVERWAREMAARLPALRPGAYRVVTPPRWLAHRPGHAWEQAVLPARAAWGGASVVFSAANLAPLAWPRNVVVLHDAVALRHPEWFSRAYAAWYRRAVPAIARRALRVIVPSRFSAQELVELAGVTPQLVSVVPGGVDERFRPGLDPEPARRALRLDHPYVLTVGGRSPRKNLRALKPVAAELRARGLEVVVAGGTWSHLGRAPAGIGVRHLGYVPDEYLPPLYAGARAFVLPSLHEGFGLTCLEAMGCGVPVVAADRGALPETCAGAALLIDPDDLDATAEAVLRAVDDEAERARLREAGLARARELTWDRAAGRIDRILADAAGR